MQMKEKQAYIEEVKYQTKMLNNLRKWMRYLVSISSICLALAIWGDNIASAVQVIGIIFTVISVIGCVLVGFALKKGSDNINKIITHLES